MNYFILSESRTHWLLPPITHLAFWLSLTSTGRAIWCTTECQESIYEARTVCAVWLVPWDNTSRKLTTTTLAIFSQHSSSMIRLAHHVLRTKAMFLFVLVHLRIHPYHIKTDLKIWSVSIHAYTYPSSIWIATWSNSSGWQIHLLAWAMAGPH